MGHCPTSGDYFASGKCYSTLQDCNGHGGFCHEAVTCYPIDSTQSEPTQPVTPENPHPCTGKVYFSEGSGFCCPAGYLYSTSCKSGVCYRTSNDAYNDTEGCSTITEGISQ